MKKILAAIGIIFIGLGVFSLIAAAVESDISLVSYAISETMAGILLLSYAKVFELITEISASAYFIKRHIESKTVNGIYEQSKKEQTVDCLLGKTDEKTPSAAEDGERKELIDEIYKKFSTLTPEQSREAERYLDYLISKHGQDNG